MSQREGPPSAGRTTLAPREALIALGANLDWNGKTPAQTLASVVEQLSAAGRLIAHSDFWQTPAWPDPGEPDFVNAVVRWQAPRGWSPRETLRYLQELETRHGRTRTRANAPRTLDLDLLAFGMMQWREPDLVVPHPRMLERAFVLLPLRDCCPLFCHPETGEAVEAALNRMAASQLADCKRLEASLPLHGQRGQGRAR